ncbi:DNA topoisomerase 1 alpha [Picochlorum sp. SENEW3]|nr:DNA topoisomerase 1 alpha [Picochlorum sp. SENEW3]
MRTVIDSDSDDDIPLSQLKSNVAATLQSEQKPAVKKEKDDTGTVRNGGSGGGGNPVQRPNDTGHVADNGVGVVKKEEESSSDDSDDDVPLSKRIAAVATTIKVKKKKKKENGEAPPRKRASAEGVKKERVVQKRAKKTQESTAEIRWKTLEHHGVLFPPEYEPHGVKMLYDGVPVDLTPEQEEVATFFAVMKETDYMKKSIFLENFWEGFKGVLGPNHRIQCLEKCDFTPIYDWHMAERERKKDLPKEEKERLKKEKEEKEAPFKYALIDGKKEPVGNFRVEPPGLFRGRGEHPKMGKIKKRIYPRDITINISKGAPIPTHPFPGQDWKEIRHDNTVTWLAFWKDPISPKDFKYVMMAATSSWKSESDLQKYEKARKLKDYIDDIRSTYTKNWSSVERRERQMATALYFIDRLALRAGHEKDEDEAETVGCCTLKCENIECIPPCTIRFDFLGKDSIRYENAVEVEETVYKNIENFIKVDGAGRRKTGNDQLFDEFDAQDLNVRLRSLMDGLSVKVFRTYNASITLDTLLSDPSKEDTIDGRKAEYDRANKEVAILCNHQRSVPKTHGAQMERMEAKMAHLQKEMKDMMKDLKLAKAGKPCSNGKMVKEDVIKGRIERKRAQIVKQEITAKNKEELKTVALGTSKINYLDPRITVAWCKRNEVPIEKVFNKSLLNKFLWAMDIEPDFKF